jgi:hypothetical protein
LKQKLGGRIAARFVCGLGAVFLYPLNRTGEQLLTDED